MPSEDEVARAILTLARERGAGRTLCPSEAARRLSDDWRPLMAEVRRVATGLAAEGRLSVTQKGREVSAETARGPIRLGLPG
ncbi:DUF3253 domain-containing protein [Histidinibacterium lentulum]|uniref:DUF3253 domain-containing protein n=1 Tax=Histidinibacterium lentulum TaxID=2480588 RepID=A0A3N2QV60_9RHOB|nr:DUF3253 domain-containing protein [Histidinibacterium lentulum]ROT99111.1 DUF3253 domain-containing protein [Histidinibacterium lentulum]